MSYFALGQERLVKTLVFLGCSWGTRRVQHALLTIRIAVAEPQGTHSMFYSQKEWLSVFSLGLVIKVL